MSKNYEDYEEDEDRVFTCAVCGCLILPLLVVFILSLSGI